MRSSGTLSIASMMTSDVSQIGKMFVKTTGSRPAQTKYEGGTLGRSTSVGHKINTLAYSIMYMAIDDNITFND